MKRTLLVSTAVFAAALFIGLRLTQNEAPAVLAQAPTPKVVLPQEEEVAENLPIAPESEASEASEPDDELSEKDPFDQPVDLKRQVAGAIPQRSSFYEAMVAEGLEDSLIYLLTTTAKPHYNLGRVRPGQDYRLSYGPKGEFQSFIFETGPTSYLEVKRAEEGLHAEIRPIIFDVCIKEVRGTIRTSLYESLVEMGGRADLAAHLGDIYAWEIDFFKDIRRGDEFSILYEEYWRGDEFSHLGRILAAEFVNQDHPHFAFFFDEDPESGAGGYYDEKGLSLQKQFLRAPLKYSRISSSYSHRRLHPVHKRYMPHYGIDYAAPHGTPIYSTGDGLVEVAGYRRGNGNYVRIRHNSTYTTYYLHLSRYAQGIRKGVRVRQGQCIGYVGATGSATGPHLDYRIKKNGRFVNPRTLDLPPDKPVPQDHLASYHDRVTYYLSLFETRFGGEIQTNVAASAPATSGVPKEERAGTF